MSDFLETPIIFLIFNRPDTTRRVFEAIRKVKPRHLYVVADGPRSETHPEDIAKCAATRKIIDEVNWECDLKKDYSDTNLGCKDRVHTGITNAFKHYERAIILEDDCLPSEDFFPYCETLLNKYADNPQIMHIGGGNFQNGIQRGTASYYFSKYAHIWGWATWKRAWEHYDPDLKSWPEFEKNASFNSLMSSEKEKAFFKMVFDTAHEKRTGTWDFQWMYTLFHENGLSIIPQENMISNIGFGEDSTHTAEAESFKSNMAYGKMQFPLTHPDTIEANKDADLYDADREFIIKKTPFFKRLKKSAKKRMQKLKALVQAN